MLRMARDFALGAWRALFSEHEVARLKERIERAESENRRLRETLREVCSELRRIQDTLRPRGGVN